MAEARQIMELSAPYTSYVLPAVLIFSIVAVADLMFEFLAGLFDRLKKKRRFV